MRQRQNTEAWHPSPADKISRIATTTYNDVKKLNELLATYVASAALTVSPPPMTWKYYAMFLDAKTSSLMYPFTRPSSSYSTVYRGQDTESSSVPEDKLKTLL